MSKLNEMAFAPLNHSTTHHADSRRYRPALITLAVLYLMIGFITCLNDTLVPFFKAGFTLNYAESALVQFYFFLTYAVMSIPSGRIVEKVGYKRGMVLGFCIAGIGALLFYPAAAWHEYSLFLGALLVLAIGIVLLQVAANPYITLLGKPETASSRLTLIQGVGSVGTTIAPLFGAHFILSGLSHSDGPSDAVGLPYLAIGGFLFLIALVVSSLALPRVMQDPGSPAQSESQAQTQSQSRSQPQSGSQAQSQTQSRERTSRGLFSFRNLNFGLVGIFMYVGAEVAIGTFLTNYIADSLRIEEYAANNYVAFYWGGMLVGRLVGSGLLKLIRAETALAIAAVAAVGLMAVSIFSGAYLAVWTMIAVGLCNSVMFAIIFSLSVKGLGEHTTRASGLLSTAIAGGAVVPYLQGVLIDHTNWEVAFLLPMACYVYIIFFACNGYKAVIKSTNVNQ